MEQVTFWFKLEYRGVTDIIGIRARADAKDAAEVAAKRKFKRRVLENPCLPLSKISVVDAQEADHDCQ